MDLITGGAGLLGQHLAAALAARGRGVRVFDFQAPVQRVKGVEYVRGDVRDANAVRAAAGGAEIVYHLAAIMHVGSYDDHTAESVNVGGLRAALHAAADAGAWRFVFTSSIEIYGTAPPLPCTEDAPANPPPGYPEHKQRGEGICSAFSKQSGLEIAMVRLPMVFGPGFYHFKPMLHMFELARLGLPLWVMDGGEQRGVVVGVRDAVQGLTLAGSHPAAAGRVFNICGPDVITHREFAEGLLRCAHSRAKILDAPSRLLLGGVKVLERLGVSPIAPEHFRFLLHDCIYDITRARNELGYEPRTPCLDAVCETYKSYLKNRRRDLLRSAASRAVRH